MDPWPQAREGCGSPRCSASQGPLGSEAGHGHRKPQLATSVFISSSKPVARTGAIWCRRGLSGEPGQGLPSSPRFA